MHSLDAREGTGRAVPGLGDFSYIILSILKAMNQSWSPSSHQFYLFKWLEPDKEKLQFQAP